MRVSMRLGAVELRRGHDEVLAAGLVEVVEPAEVGDPDAQQMVLAAEVAALAGELEQQVERAGAVVEVLVPVVGGAHHAVAEPVGGDRELDRHRRHLGRRRADLEQLAAVREDVVHDRLVDDAGQEVGADHPLVVLADLAPGAGELLRLGRRRRQRVADAVVEADERQVGLRDDEVLVVARLRDERRAPRRRVALADAGQVEVGERRIAACDRRAHLQVQAVAVELRRPGVVRPGAVERVEVEHRRAALEQVGGRDVDAEHDARLVERQVVVDELAEVGEAGRDPRPGARPGGHRLGELAACHVAQLLAAAGRAHAREAERRRQGLDLGRERLRAAAAALGQEALAEHVVALRPVVFH